MPLNLEMEERILNHSDLLEDLEMPEVLLKLMAHIAAYKPVLKSWERGDFSQNSSLLRFPDELKDYAMDNYSRLKKKQAVLLGELERR